MGTDTRGGRASAVLHNSGLLAVAKVLERATGFVVALLIAAFLGAEGLGVYAVAWAIYGFVTIASDAGASSYLVREISRRPEDTAAYTVHLSAVALLVSIVLIVVGELVVPHLGYSTELETSVAIVLLAIVPRVLNTIQEAVFVAHRRVAFETSTRLGASLLYVGAVVLLLRRGSGVPTLLTVLVVIEYVVAGVYFALISRFIASLQLRFHWSLAWRMVRDMRWFTASTVLAALFSRPEVVIMSLVASEREVGLYSAALRLAELPMLVPEVFMTNVFPLLSHSFGTAEDRFTLWHRVSTRAMLAFSLPIAAVLVAGADDIVALVYGDDFGAAATVLRVLALSIVFHSLISVSWRALVARNRQRSNVAVQAVMVVARLAAGTVLIATWADLGAAITASAAAALHLVLLAWATGRSGADTRIFGAGWRFAVAAGAAGLTVWILGLWLPAPASMAGGAVVYLATSVAVGALEADDRLVLGRLRASRPPS